jgi:PAS domain S-box-containing protein
MSSASLNLNVFEERFQTIFKEAPFSAALLSGDDFKIEMANDASLLLWGKDESIIGKPLLSAMPEIRDQEVYKKLCEVYQTGKIFEGRERTAYLNVHGTLKKIYVNFILKPIHDNQGKLTSVLAVGYDVTDQVESKQKLEQLEARSRVAIESVGLGTFERDYQNNEIFTSSRFNEIFGFSQSQPHPNYISKIHPEDLPIREKAHEEGLKTGAFSYEARLLVDAQPERWIKVHGRYLFDDNREPLRLVGTVLDITREKLALNKIQESEQRFRTLITETPEVGVALYTGPEIRIQYVNEVMLKVWNKDESILGKTIREALPVLEGQPFFDLLDTVYKTGIAHRGTEEKAILEIDGKLEARYFNYTYKALKNENGEVYGIHHMSVDVTEQVKNKMALIEREESVRRLFEQTPVGIAMFNGPSLIIEMVNTIMLRYWGRRYDEVINRSLFDALPEIKEQGIDKIAVQVFETGVPFSTVETPVSLLRNGKMETIIVNFGFQPQRDADGKIIGLLGIANDVTDMVMARKHVEKNEMRLQELANSMPQVVWIANEDGSVSYYNDRVLAFSGVTKTASGIWQWEGTVHPDELDRTVAAWQLAVKNQQVYEMEHRIQMIDGSYRWHLSRAYPYQTDEGVRWYGTATDIHDQKVLEMNLENLVKKRTLELERSNDDLQQFAHVASHDLKEPIRKINIFSNLLHDEFKVALGERGEMLINKIIHATNRMFSMINGVLYYSSLGGIKNDLNKVDLNTIIHNIITDLEVLVLEKNAQIHFEELPVVMANPDLMHQLFYNLINNSLKFSKKDEPLLIQIKARETHELDKHFFEITVADNGIGFEEKYAEKIFTTFYRLNSKDKYEGSGLGLALCKKIVERYGGYITAEGKRNIGATFKIYLPIK